MKQHSSRMTAPELEAAWDFKGTEFSLPHHSGTGCMQIAQLPQDGKLYCSEYRVINDCQVDTATDPVQLPQLLCSQVLLSGQLELETPDGRRHANTPNRALLMRLHQPGSRLHLPGNQVIRHVGVALPLHHEGLVAPELTATLSDFHHCQSDSLVHGVPWSKRTRSLATELFQLAAAAEQPVLPLRRDGLARCFLASLLEDYGNHQLGHVAPDEAASVWEQQIIAQICDYISRQLATPLRSDDLALHFGLSRHRLNDLFRSLVGQSASDYIREKRLTTAREQIETQGLPVKVAAHNVGYRHVSNFTNAYRQYFGVTPGQSQLSAIQQ
ncbi:helix-turn-helix transcriptional regulator [Marinobacter sp. CA1]|uniref:helix-turn-helix transcriptional regulator n=1 Tax=Marinobacter sp. CA1 TaxID=2817656 RepID=UPI001D07181C|nr:helix-turn-helix transcriptional regulator [Marinobacter sp. CA1]UDL04893.1 helix-turn-helix transcriptional regulator [Marinobacter sp. CA1]